MVMIPLLDTSHDLDTSEDDYGDTSRLWCNCLCSVDTIGNYVLTMAISTPDIRNGSSIFFVVKISAFL